MSKTALVLIDIQNDYFDGGKWPVANMQLIAANAAAILTFARKEGLSVFHIRHESPSETAPFFRPGTRGAQIHESVKPQDNEPVITKHRPNSFFETSLKQQLKAANITDLLICGAMSQMCVDATTRAGVDLGYAVTVIEDACGAKEQVFNEREIPAHDVHAAFMAPLAMSYARVIDTQSFLTDKTL